MQNRKMIMCVLCVFLLSTIGLSAAAVEEYRQKPFSQTMDSIQFRSDVDLKTVNIEKHIDKIVVSSSEHKETSIKIKKSDIEALGMFDGALRVTHYNDFGIEDWCRVIYPKEDSEYFEIPVEFSTVVIELNTNTVANFDMESWSGATINNWVVAAGTCTQSSYRVTGSYSAKVTGTPSYIRQTGIAATPGETIDLYGWAYTDTSATIAVYFYNAGGTQTGVSWKPSTKTGQWERLSLEDIVVPANTATMTVQLTNTGAGSSYFDTIIISKNLEITATETASNNWVNTTFQYTQTSNIKGLCYEFDTVQISNYVHGKLGTAIVTIDGTPTTNFYRIDGYLFYIYHSIGAGLHTVTISQPINEPPTMLTPTNGSTVTRSFPPLYADQVFTWEDTHTICEIQVAEDTAFSNVIYDHETTADTATASLSEGTYYWRVRSYDSVFQKYGNYPPSYSVIIVAGSGSVTGTGLHGVVYESLGLGMYDEIQGALVTVYNETYSITKTTGSEGYFQVLGLYNGTYYVQAEREGYDDSLIAAVNVTAGSVTVQNIALQRSQSYFAPHDVKFTFKNHRYSLRPLSNVSYSIYENSNTAAKKTGITDSTGSFVVSGVSQSMKYRIVATHTDSKGVTRTLTEYIEPSDTKYILYFSKAVKADTEKFAESVNITVSKAAINTTAANITIAWNDTTSNMTSVSSVLSFNGTNLATGNSTAAAGQISLVAYNYTGKSYLLQTTFVHPEFGTVIRNHSVTFGGSNIPFAGSILLGYLAIFILLIVATQFGKLEHATGSIAFVALAWVFFFIGMFDGFQKNAALELGLTVATLYAIMVYMISRKEGGA